MGDLAQGEVAMKTEQAYPPDTLRDVVEASELDLKPGVFPQQLVYQRRTYCAVGLDRDSEGELMAVRYETEEGRRLVVLND
jgi:hypothetical protein